MSGHLLPLLGAVVVIGLFAAYPPLGMFAFVAALLVGLALRVLRIGRYRPCPRCGERVRNGVLECPHCSFDFTVIGANAEQGS